MLEVRGLGVGADFLCTACVEHLFRKGAEDRLPPNHRAADWLLAYEARLLWGPFLRSGLPRGARGEILAVALDEAAAFAALPSGAGPGEEPSSPHVSA